MAFCARENVQLLALRCDVRASATVHRLVQLGFRLMDTLVHTALELAHPVVVPSTESVRTSVARPQDAGEVGALSRSAFADYVSHYHADPRLSPTATAEAYGEWAEQLCRTSGEDQPCLVAYDASGLVGFAALRAGRPDQADCELCAVAGRARRRTLGDWIVVMDGDLQDRPEDIPGLHKRLWTENSIWSSPGACSKVSPPRKSYPRFCSTGPCPDWAASRPARGSAITGFLVPSGGSLRALPGAVPILSRDNGASWLQSRIPRRRSRGRAAGQIRLQSARAHAVGNGRHHRQFRKAAPARNLSRWHHGRRDLGLGILDGLVCRAVRVHISGWAILLIALAFLAGVQLAFSGLVGLYVGRIFNETKQRPLYLVAESVKFRRFRANAAAETSAIFSQIGERTDRVI